MMKDTQKGKAIARTQPELGKAFEPNEQDAEIYRFWEENGCFKASDENATHQNAFCIVIPPPNVTGVLHMGHALTNTIQDILVRWRRMKGDNTLWVPGTDHAGIATQAQVEKAIAKEGKGPSGRPLTRHDLGREAFLARTWKWKEEHGTQITQQLKKLGSSLDWSRERFTMDEGLSAAVREVFVRLYKENLIYRGERLINWCIRCQTALSDLEVIPTEKKGQFWHIRYPVVDDQGKPVLNPDGTPASLVIATTRPETLLGDTAVAIHPEDERYLHLHGKKVKLPLLGRILPIILDAYVDREFGSGALKVTPAHDFNDYELGKKHQLQSISVISKEGFISPEGGKYAGIKLADVRKQVVTDLEEAGLLVKTEDHVHKVGLCQRCETVVEPLLSQQWFVRIEPLARPAIDAVKEGKIEFFPKSWEKTYFEWMLNIRDWCISRQLWWGHQIPAWYCSECEGITVEKTAPVKCSHCQAPQAKLKQDEDVLDTWFSSGLWPFSTLGWPEATPALKTFYPTSILETGFDIIFFWVARMIMMGIHFMGEVPFKRVYLHAMVRDEKGEKMSKSKGNVIDPLTIIQQHGADPLRFTLAIMAGQGRDIKLSIDRVEGYRAFCNKIWNATRFFLMQLDLLDPAEKANIPVDIESHLLKNHAQLSVQNKWILSRFQKTVQGVEESLERFELNVASQELYDFTWHEFCDWFIEFSKLPLREGGEERVQSVLVLYLVLEHLFRLLHPFMPFVTETLWTALPWKKPSTTTQRKNEGREDIYTLMLQSFPVCQTRFQDVQAERSVEAIKRVIEALRNFRGENRIAPKVEIEVNYRSDDPSAESFLKSHAAQIQALTRVKQFQKTSTRGETEAVIPISDPSLEFRINLQGLVNIEEESKRLKKEIENIQSDLDHVERKLSQPTFISKAPPELVEKERSRQSDLRKKLDELNAASARLQKLTAK